MPVLVLNLNESGDVAKLELLTCKLMYLTSISKDVSNTVCTITQTNIRHIKHACTQSN